LGILGGTFDPPHLGHLVLAEAAREELGLAKVMFVPAGDPWRKAGLAVSSSEQRVEMVRLAINGNPGFELSMMEVKRRGPTYTADTLEALATERPEAELFFLLGEDALADLPNWKEPRRILEMATLAVARRPKVEHAAGLPAPLATSGRLKWLEMPLLEISATRIRDRVRRGLSVRYLVPDAVDLYIRERGLYRE
jgi:nicotinate-nucleotide adenylyltransferase